MASTGGAAGAGAGGGPGAAAPTLSRSERNARTTALIAKLTEADDSLAAILDLAAQAIDILQPAAAAAAAAAAPAEDAEAQAQVQPPQERFEAATTDYFALLNDVQLFLRSAVFHLVHNAQRPPLTPAQTSTAFDALRAATAAKGHSLRPEDISLAPKPASKGAAEAEGASQGPTAGMTEAPMADQESKKEKEKKQTIIGLPEDAHLSLGALRIQHQAWADLVAALEALQQR
ncbi:ARF GAP with effector function(s) [Tilletia horrida]|nr:ARF GAP with effector function(s) [Tilletia horrida]